MDVEDEAEVDRDTASVEKPDFFPEEELTQEQIEAIELGDPEMLDEIDEANN